MSMSAAYLNLIRDAGQGAITHIALFGNGTELTGGGYARQAVTWTDDGDGVARPDADLVFTTEAGDVVDEWRGFSAATGGVDYGGASLTEVVYNNPGTFSLLAASTSINHNAA